MKKGVRKWWLLAIPVLLTAVVLTVAFWDAILIRIAPKAVLTSALSRVFTQLEERFRDDPLLIVAQTVDPDGQYTADVVLEAEKELLGPITYDMNVKTDGASHRFSASGSINTASKTLNLSLYMDSDFMAVSSEELVKGNYYGITYDTFASDLRKIPLLNYMVSDELLSQWEASVQDVQAKMRRSYTLPRMPELSQEDVQKLLFGIAALPCQIEKTSLVLLNGTAVTCHKLDYQASGKQIGQVLSRITGQTYPEDTAVTVSFYLYEDAVVKIVLVWKAGEIGRSYGLNLGLNPAEETLLLQGIEEKNGEYDEFTIAVTTQRSENRYAETWEFHKIANDVNSAASYSFQWEPTSGVMTLKTDATPEAVSFNLTGTENGFRLKTDDISQLIKAVAPKAQVISAKPLPCTMTVRKGSELIVPEYKNLDQWSMEDFLVLLSGLGTLLGIPIR